MCIVDRITAIISITTDTLQFLPHHGLPAMTLGVGGLVGFSFKINTQFLDFINYIVEIEYSTSSDPLY